MSKQRTIVRQVFHEAADLPPEQRESFLKERCAADERLRAEVASLLAHLETDGEFLERPVYSSKGPAGGASDAGVTPERFGHYHILRLLGEGGMGAVYEAEQENPRRIVALKVVRAGLASASMLRRFEHEAHVLGQLKHPGIAQIYEAGAIDTPFGKQPFFAMEFIQGLPLTDYAAKHELSVAQKLDLMARVCDAVHHAHQKGVIHRDLKPANILVEEADKGQRDKEKEGHSGKAHSPSVPLSLRPSVPSSLPKILDFGIARATDADLKRVTLQTAAGQILGTLPYMSPEQVEGDPAKLDTRSDVYALGIIIYELLAGRYPYDLSTSSIPEAARIIREEEPRPLEAVDPAFRGDVGTIVGKALQKEKERRYQSAAELAADIRRHLGDEPIAARPPTTMYQLRKFARRNRALVGGALATILTLCAGIVVALTLAVKETHQRHAAEEAADAARRSEARAQRLAYRGALSAAAVALRAHNSSAALRLMDEAPATLRNWEWRALRYAADRSLLTFPAPGERAASAAISSDGALVLTASDEGAVRLWDGRGGAIVRTFGTLGSHPVCALSPGGDLACAAARDTGTVVWDTAAGAPIWRDPGVFVAEHPFDDAGRVLLVSQADRHLALRDARTGAPIRTIPYPPRDLIRARIDHDPARLLVLDAGWTQTLDSVTGTVLNQFAFPWAEVNSDGSRLVAQEHGELILAPAAPSTSPSSEPVRFRTENTRPTFFTLSPDGSIAAVGELSGLLTRRDGRTGALLSMLDGHTTHIVDITYSASGNRVLSHAYDGVIKTWDPDAGPWPWTAGTPRDPSDAAAITPDGRTIATLRYGTVRFWNVPEGRELATVVLARSWKSGCAALDARGTRLAVGGWDNRLWILDVPGAKVSVQSRRLASRITSVAWAADGATVFGGDESGAIRSYAAADLSPLTELPAPAPGPIRALAVSAGGDVLAASAGDGSVSLRTLPAGTVTAAATPAGSSGAPVLRFSPDGSLLASGHEDGSVRLWDAHARAPRAHLPGGSGRVFGLAFSPDGTRLVAGADGGFLRVIDPLAGDEVLVLSAADTSLNTVQFDPSGDAVIASGGASSVVRFESGPPAAPSVPGGWAARERARRIRTALDDRFDALGLCDDVVEAVRGDPSLDEPTRAAMLDLAARRRDHPNNLNNDAWGPIRFPGAPEATYRNCLRLAETALRALPGDWGLINSVGVARYRVGDWEVALTTVRRSNELAAAEGAGPHPINLCVAAMAEYKLGRTDEARRDLAAALAIPRDPDAGARKDNEYFLHEAAELIGR